MAPDGTETILDVRHYHEEGREPFGDIMATVNNLNTDMFVLINTFEPYPLYRVMKARGFEHHAEQVADGHWRITFWRSDDPGESEESAGG